MWTFVIGVTLAQLLAFVIFARILSKKVNARKKQTSVQVREAKLIEIYDRLEGLMDSFEDYLGEVRADIDDKRTEVNDLARQVGVLYSRMNETPRPRYPSEPVEVVRSMAVPLASNTATVSTVSQTVHAMPSPESKTPAAASEEPVFASRLSKRDRASLDRFVSKPQKVRFLMSLGLPLEDVAREMEIGKGEVRLIADLEK